MENAEQISLEESMKNCLFYLDAAVLSVAGGPERAYLDMGEISAAAWELRQELLAGQALLQWQGISERVRVALEEMVSLVNALPEAVFQGEGFEGLCHPAWGEVRGAAKKFIGVRHNDAPTGE
ncbi:hypothetical protein PWP89_05240 [Stenotrophomonas rhizophila]|uniref:hypothetical protein n=2 Tax=Stenotrophomonas rhizophila TaxID=216778 RepID=UPI00081CC38B|nr:hypothetical protein [Stenotrophomonas rhizophila]AOA73526.1 hypothetical protein BAY15_3094 [Stenotrophomonas rhizophila]